MFLKLFLTESIIDKLKVNFLSRHYIISISRPILFPHFSQELLTFAFVLLKEMIESLHTHTSMFLLFTDKFQRKSVYRNFF